MALQPGNSNYDQFKQETRSGFPGPRLDLPCLRDLSIKLVWYFNLEIRRFLADLQAPTLNSLKLETNGTKMLISVFECLTKPCHYGDNRPLLANIGSLDVSMSERLAIQEESILLRRREADYGQKRVHSLALNFLRDRERAGAKVLILPNPAKCTLERDITEGEFHLVYSFSASTP